jgi:hypothetical protein
LQTHRDDLSREHVIEAIFNALLAKQCLPDMNIDAESLIHHLCQTHTNVYGIFDINKEDSEKGTQTVTQVRIAEAMYSTSSLLNHSCRPNVSLEYNGRTLIIRYPPTHHLEYILTHYEELQKTSEEVLKCSIVMDLIMHIWLRKPESRY